jgi:outer membrane protein TolC
MKKKLIAVILASSMCLSSVPVMAGEVSFEIDGLVEANAGTVINRQGYNMLGMREVFELLGADVEWNSVKRCVTAEKDGKTVVLYVDTNKGYVDNEPIKLPTNCVNVDGHIYVPVRFVSEAFGYDISWDAETRKIVINTGNEKYTLLDMTPDITDSTKILTYDEALKLALNNNSSLKDIDESVDYLDELRDDLGDLIWSLDQQESMYSSNLFNLSQQTNDVLAAQLALQTNIESTIEAARNIKNVEIQKQMVDVNKEMVSDGVELALKSYINNIKTTQTQIELLEANVKLGQENIENLELKNKLGYESDYSLQTAKTSQLANESNLKMLKLNLANQKQTLNTLLGLDANEDVYVESDVNFDALQDVNLEKYVTSKRETDPSIKTLKNTVTLAEYKERTNKSYDSESTISVRNELNSAKRALDDGKDSLEKNIRNAYNNIQQLEENNNMLLRAVEQAKADYNSVVTSYKSGMATEYQVKQAKLGILSAEKNVEDNARSYDLLTFTFDRPYLLGASS